MKNVSGLYLKMQILQEFLFDSITGRGKTKPGIVSCKHYDIANAPIMPPRILQSHYITDVSGDSLLSISYMQ